MLRKSHDIDVDVVPIPCIIPCVGANIPHSLHTTNSKMGNQPLPATPLPNRFPSSTATPPPLPTSASKTPTGTAAVKSIKRFPAMNGSTQQTRSKSVPIAPHPAAAPAPPSNRARVMRRGYLRAPSNEFCPRGCQNCGWSFVPGSFGSDFCSGECRHSFAFLRHMDTKIWLDKNKRHDKKY